MHRLQHCSLCRRVLSSSTDQPVCAPDTQLDGAHRLVNGALRLCAGVSVDGTVMRARDSINRDFYGRPLTAKQLLTGDSPAQPLAARPLYAALDDMLACYGIPRCCCHTALEFWL